ncbi:ATP-grasp domain-containing protein [Streptomyces eurythermus]
MLLLGWNAGRAAAALAGLGARVTCAAEPSEAAAARGSGLIAETVVVTDSADTQAVLAGLARSGHAPHDYAAVAPSQETRVVAAAVLGALGGAAAPPLDSALALRDKAVQKRLIRAAGIPTAASAVAASAVDVPLVPLRFPVVVKSPGGQASLGTERLDSRAHARTWTYRAAHDGPWQVEEFVPGAEVHLDGVVRGGELTALAVSRYLGNVFTTHNGAPMGSVVTDPRRAPDLYRHGRSLTARALAALGHRDGVFHLKAFEQPDGSLVFGECAGRVAGGRIDEVVRRKLGVDLHQQWAAALLARPAPPPRTPAATTPSASSASPPPPESSTRHRPPGRSSPAPESSPWNANAGPAAPAPADPSPSPSSAPCSPAPTKPRWPNAPRTSPPGSTTGRTRSSRAAPGSRHPAHARGHMGTARRPKGHHNACARAHHRRTGAMMGEPHRPAAGVQA